MTPRNEPLLWLQLVAIGAIPLELQLLRLILAGSDLGPVPSVERLLCWGIAVVAPAVLLWRRPVDWGSLLLVRQPLKKRTTWQRKISHCQDNLLLKLVGAAGAVLLLALFWWIDRSSLLIADLSPLRGTHRLQSLLIATPLLAIIFWQWHQLVQSIWLLSRPSMAIEAAVAMSDSQLEDSRFSLGLSLLRLETLDWDTADVNTPTVDEPKEPQKSIEVPPPPEPSIEQDEEALSDSDSNPVNDNPNTEELNLPKAPDLSLSSAVEPEQTAEQNDSPDLDPKVTDVNSVSSSDFECHDEQAKSTGSEESDPKQAPE
jgi:hypothetical protein